MAQYKGEYEEYYRLYQKDIQEMKNNQTSLDKFKNNSTNFYSLMDLSELLPANQINNLSFVELIFDNLSLPFKYSISMQNKSYIQDIVQVNVV